MIERDNHRKLSVLARIYRLGTEAAYLAVQHFNDSRRQPPEVESIFVLLIACVECPK